MRDRQCALNHDAIESAPIVSSVINKPTTLSCVYHLGVLFYTAKIFLVNISGVEPVTPPLKYGPVVAA